MGYVDVTVTVRNVYGDPLSGKVVDCSAVPVTGTFCFCTGEDPQQGTTDTNGEVVFTYAFFGGCGTMQWSAQSEGVVFNPSATLNVASPDGNGDCAVDLTDFVNFAAAYQTADPCFDFNCDGIVDLTDFVNFAAHYQHACP
jgi:hypothetical protein